MTDIPEGWVLRRHGPVSGSKYYENDKYPGFTVYDAGAEGEITIYQGDRTFTARTLKKAFELVHGKANPQDELELAAALVVTSISQRNLKSTNSTYTVTVPRHQIERLHAAVEELFPGWVERIYEGRKKADSSG